MMDAVMMALGLPRPLVYILSVITVEILIDQLFVRRVVLPKARYFVLHVVFNTWLTICVWRDAVDALRAPETALLGDADSAGFAHSAVMTTAGISGFHIYHMLFFSGISSEDWNHHVVSCIIVPIVGICAPFGKVVSISNLGMCGLPGAIDFALLAGVKYGVVDRVTEKRVNSLLNLMIRFPLQLLASYAFCVGWSNGTLAKTTDIGGESWVQIAMSIGVVLHTLNAAYYCQKVIGNYHVVVAAHVHTE